MEILANDIKVIKNKVVKGESRVALIDITIVLCKLMAERYKEFYNAAPADSKLNINEIKLSKSKGQTDDKIGLGQWIGIYEKCSFFDPPNANYFNAAVLNKINELRNTASHQPDAKAQQKLTKININNAYIDFINILDELRQLPEQRYHHLCELCLNAFAEAHKVSYTKDDKSYSVCKNCASILKAIAVEFQDRWEKANDLIFRVSGGQGFELTPEFIITSIHETPESRKKEKINERKRKLDKELKGIEKLEFYKVGRHKERFDYMIEFVENSKLDIYNLQEEDFYLEVTSRLGTFGIGGPLAIYLNMHSRDKETYTKKSFGMKGEKVEREFWQSGKSYAKYDTENLLETAELTRLKSVKVNRLPAILFGSYYKIIIDLLEPARDYLNARDEIMEWFGEDSRFESIGIPGLNKIMMDLQKKKKDD